ncbi:hypothetical protein A1O1_06907 [Capronia coronata CBS 617.96]|uniref:Uncharacterized protein n=1 Tax=Capronia coronata CBS 617.96 TaxID=1182541 RepID=W9XSS7_9EURO|nr:uncharacterized protein A1O1_06907 [Capronia coronata CBS 617.96]EXJ83288.1 hypothetical protein A1O1_06907 [Capronia coronata CBS 617.96]
MATVQSRVKLKGPLLKPKISSNAMESSHATNTIHFAKQQPPSHSQRVIVLDFSITPEPFLDSVGLENIRKRQQMEQRLSSGSAQ